MSTRSAASPTPPTTSSPLSVLNRSASSPSSTLTPYQIRVLTALCQVPRGQYTTYAYLAAFLDSSPRAVGNALRRNPCAPEVPCHRVLATGGGLGGFKGEWAGKWRKDGNGKGDVRREGITLDEKVGLLRSEGVRFDGRGKVVGRPWREFV